VSWWIDGSVDGCSHRLGLMLVGLMVRIDRSVRTCGVSKNFCTSPLITAYDSSVSKVCPMATVHRRVSNHLFLFEDCTAMDHCPFADGTVVCSKCWIRTQRPV
jgi:hypothetical protein